VHCFIRFIDQLIRPICERAVDRFIARFIA
jgi:hypothetical protein